MNLERERKFLVVKEKLPKDLGKGKRIQTGYFTNDNVAIRVSIGNQGEPNEKCKICFKGPGTEERQEFEYTIPNEDAHALIKLSPTYLTKTRYDFEGWEIDCLDLPTEKFWMAEWEEHEGKAPIPEVKPEWVGYEVTSKIEFTNMRIAWTFPRRIA